MSTVQHDYVPGRRVRVTQQVPRLSGVWTTQIEGVIVGFGQSKSGSWYAHTRDKKVWIDRLKIRKDDGEIVVLNLDQYSHVDMLDGSAPESPAQPA